MYEPILVAVDGSAVAEKAVAQAVGLAEKHHLKRLLPDEKNLIVLVGYRAAGTAGRKFQEGAQFIRMHGRDGQAHIISSKGFPHTPTLRTSSAGRSPVQGRQGPSSWSTASRPGRQRWWLD